MTNQHADLCNHNQYIIYDHAMKRYYVMQLASNYRYIAVAEDLSEMYKLLKEHA